ncbi:MAG: OsmC family protein [Rhodobacteraceae bacterium]|nr:OsmC family protein [Paracoccaceae bacterium]
MDRHANAVWYGDLQKGSGRISSESGVLSKHNYSFQTRFEDGPGTNPEELIAAAHAGCYAMAFSHELDQAGMTPESVEAKATVTLSKVSDGFEIPSVALEAVAKVPGADADKVREIGEAAKEACPVSKVLNAKITLDLTVEV